MNSGGFELISGGGTATATTINSGGRLTVESDTEFGVASVNGTLVNRGGEQDVIGLASATTLNAGLEIVSSGGTAIATTVNSGGLEKVNTAGATISDHVLRGGEEIVSSGGTVSATVVDTGGTMAVDGTAIGTIVNGGTQWVNPGGVTSSTVAENGGTQIVYSSGSASGTLVSAASFQTISRGSTTGTVVLSGGFQGVFNGGIAGGTVISTGGEAVVYAGGTDRFSTISQGGIEFIRSAGTVSGGTVISGASMTVSSGGIVAAGLTLSGGTANISGSLAAGQTMNFAGAGGDLVLFNLPAFAAVIGGFGTSDKIDLGSFAFGSATTRSFTEAPSHTSGTLSVVNGASQAHLTLLGSYVTSNFALSNDGAGRTLVKFA